LDFVVDTAVGLGTVVAVVVMKENDAMKGGRNGERKGERKGGRKGEKKGEKRGIDGKASKGLTPPLPSGEGQSILSYSALIK
jgi:hypothetical protein